MSRLTRVIRDIDATRPSAPTGLSGTPVSQTQINLSWNAATDPAGSATEAVSGVVGYRLYRNGTLRVDQAGLTFNDTALTAYTVYSYTITSYDAAGNESFQSSAITPRTLDTTAPTAPVITATQTGQTSISVALTTPSSDSLSGVATYALEYKRSVDSTWTVISGLTSAQFPRSITGLTAGTQYDTRCRATDVSLNTGSYSATSQATTTSSGTGNTINAASASRTDVLAAIALTSPGDTVVVPAGTVSWSGDVSISGITLKGPGRNAGSPLNVTAGQVNITKHATQMTTLRGIRFTGSSQHINIGGAASNQFFRVHDCYLFGDNAHILQIGVNGGLFSDCDFQNTNLTSGGNHVHLTMGASGGGAVWAAAHTMGTADTNGTANVYFEDCTMTNYRDGFPDVDDGGKCVIRHCTLNDTAIITHGGGSGGSGNDSSQYGARHLEVYNNRFNRVDQSANGPFNQWVYFRGSSGVVANNVWDNPSTAQYGGKSCIRIGVGNCAAGYPRQYQAGQSTQTADSTPDAPIQIFGNTGTTQTIGVEANPNTTCGNPGSLVQAGRDYILSQTWWTAYTYPHPLRPT